MSSLRDRVSTVADGRKRTKRIVRRGKEVPVTNARVHVLMIDDDLDAYELVRTMLTLARGTRFELDWVRTFDEAVAAIERGDHDAYLVDYRIDGTPIGLDLIEQMRARGHRRPMILLTSEGDREVDERALQIGAADYLDKSQLDSNLLERAVRYAIERSKSLEALRRSQEFLQVTVDALAASLAILDETGSIIAINQAWRQVLVGSGLGGASCGVGDNFVEVCESAPEEDRPAFLKLAAGIRDVIAGRRDEFITEYQSRDAGDERMWGIARVTRFPGEGLGRAVVSCEDVTELKRAEAALRQSEEQLRQAQKLEAIGRLAGGVAHDFNNLLTAISGHADFMLRRMDGADPLFWHAEGVKKAAARAAGLTRQLLAFSRKQIFEPRVLDVNDIVEDLERMLRRIIGEDIDLTTNLAERVPRIEADPGQIEQVVVNLVVNARDAMERGGALAITTTQADLGPAEAARLDLVPGRYVVLRVSDTGTGMDAAICDRIFEPFFTTKPQGKGTGLGLATVHGIVAQSGGAIHVASEPGRGTTFTIYLPAVDAPPSEVDGTGGGEASLGGSETVLLVEDDAMVREVARRILQTSGFLVLEVSSAAEAVAVCRQYDGPIHLVLTDVVMPGMSGRELAETMARIRPDTRVLYMSGYLDDAIDHLGVLRESDRFISKPFLPLDLVGKIRDVLDR
jgi:two-component system, cell cycle sensor histidine kinase and response regulator CckA